MNDSSAHAEAFFRDVRGAFSRTLATVPAEQRMGAVLAQAVWCDAT